MITKGQFQYQDEFTQDLIETYTRIKHEHLQRYGRISRPALLQAVVNSPARCFYASEEQASRVISAMLKGKTFPNMKPLTRQMYLEIYSRVLALRKIKPKEPLLHQLTAVLNEPAPRFYITPRALEMKLCKLKTTHREYNRTGRYAKKNRTASSGSSSE